MQTSLRRDPAPATGTSHRAMRIAAWTDWALGTEARAHALLDDGDAAERLYREAVERARSELLATREAPRRRTSETRDVLTRAKRRRSPASPRAHRWTPPAQDVPKSSTSGRGGSSPRRCSPRPPHSREADRGGRQVVRRQRG